MATDPPPRVRRLVSGSTTAPPTRLVHYGPAADLKNTSCLCAALIAASHFCHSIENTGGRVILSHYPGQCLLVAVRRSPVF